MEDLKQIQEFFSKPLNENAFVEAFKFEKALKGMGYDVKVKYLDDFGKDVFEIYFNNPADADESIFYDAKELGYDNVRVFANPNESLDEAYIVTYAKNKGEKPASAAYKLRGSALAFMRDLEKDGYITMLTQKPVDGVDEAIDEYNSGIYYDPAKERNAVKEVPKKTFFSILKDIKNLALKLAKDNAKEASQYVKSGKAIDMNPMADIAKVQQDLIGQAQLDEGIKDAINNITKFTGAGSLLTGGGYLLSYLDQLELKYYQWYYGKIKEMADFEIFELLKNKYGIEEQISTWEQKVLMYAFFVFFTIFVVAIGAKLVSKGISKLKKEDLSDYEEKDANYDELYSDYLYKMVKEVVAQKGFSKYLKSKDNPKGETDGLTPQTLNKILMNVIKDLDELKQLGEGMIEEELCEKGKAYRKKRMAAGEKSSAYLNGRAVKVCKGQMKG